MQKSNQNLVLQWHAQILSAVPDAAFVHDDAGRFIDVNQLACDSVGYTRDALLLMLVADIFRNFNLLEAQLQWRQLKSDKPLVLHWQQRRRVGHDNLVEVRVGLLEVDGHRMYVTTVRDESTWHGLQDALRLSEERYQQAARAAQLGIFTDNLVTCQGVWSHEFRNIVGVEANALPTAMGSVLAFVHPDDHEFVQMALNHALDPSSDGKLDSIHRLVRHSNAALRWVQVIGKVEFALVAGRRQATVINGFLIDITDRMQVKHDLLQSQQRFELALNASPISLFEQDTALRYTWHCNSILGLKTGDFIGKTDMEILDPRSAKTVTDLKQGVLQTGLSARQELPMLRPDGSVAHVDMTLRVRRNAKGEIIGIMGTGFDVTEARNAKVRLEELNAVMQTRSLQVESVNTIRSRFLSTVSHELRTPLHTLLGYLRLARDADPAEVDGYLQIAELSGRQLLKQIGDLLSVNRQDKELGSLQPEVVELRTVMEQIEHTSLMLAPGGANRFVMEMADDLPRMVEMDAYRLMQVLDNLIGNACKFTHSGLITLQIFRDAVPAADAKNCRLCFVVQDSGEGMAAKDLDKIFDLFVRLDKNHLAPGMGVGLSIVRQWTRAMGGDIQVESAPGQGSRFSFVVEFPDVSHTDTSAAVGCSQECEVLHDRVCTLLVVDDVEENRRLLRHFCARWGYQVVEADGVIQAMAALHDASVCIDAVLVDQFMVDSSGWQLLRELRQTPAFAFLPIALISASDPQRPDEFPNDLQFDLILGKPLDYPVLARFLCDALGGVQCVQRESEVLRAPRVVAPRTVLATEDLQYLRQLLDLGRVVRIVGWAYDLAKRDPQLQTFSDKVIRLAQAADLPGLERLVQQVRAV